MKEIATVPADNEDAEATEAILSSEGSEMESGRYAGIIRLRIKRRRFSCQNWHKSDARNSKLASFVPAAVTETLHSWHTKHTLHFLGTYQENRQRSSLACV